MKREKARLEELRAMSYKQYLQTPEWQETQKAVLKRAGNRCQVCRGEGVALRVYHTTLDTLGCEQEGDVIALCEACYDHLAQKVQRFADQTAGQANDSDEDPVAPQLSLGQKALVFTPTAIVLDGLFALLHAPLPAELFGLGAAIALAASSPKIYAGIRESLPESWQQYLDERAARKQQRAATGEWSNWDRLLGRHLYAPDPAAPHTQVNEELLVEDGEKIQAENETGLFSAGQQAASLSIARVTIEEICAHIQRNSYTVYVGRSLTEEGNPAVLLNWYKQHIEIIGVTQRGKSSMAAAFMDAVTRTHDPDHLQLALLDRENQTSTLFAHLPHVMTWRGTKLHARTPEEVVEQLELIVEIMEYRYTLPAQERANLPVLLVYLEEFLALKKELKLAIATLKDTKDDQKLAEATRRYAQLVQAVNKIALRGLKARVQFLLCAQVDYADKEFREAFAMFGIRFSFGVDPDAARATGFTANELLAQNAKSKQFGEAVIEAPGTKDLLWAPDFPLEQRIIELEARSAHQWSDQLLASRIPETPALDQQVYGLGARKVYHTHEGSDVRDRRQARLQRQRGYSPQIALSARSQEAHPAEPEQRLRLLPPSQPRKTAEELEEEELAVALQCWQAGNQAGRPLAAAMQVNGYPDTSVDRAYNLMGKLENRGLIVVQRKRKPALS